jgi:hypothetical protein
MYDVAIENNAMEDGWGIGIHTMGSEYPSHTDIRFTPKELHTVVRLARYFVASEQRTENREGVAS